MKIFKNNSILIRGFMMVICFTFFTACEEGPNFRIQEYPEQTATGISHTSGYPGINVTITGTDFGTLKGAVKVYFGGILATNVVSCEDTKIVVQVPATAISGKVSLQVWKHLNDSFAEFTVLPAPAITSVVSSNAINTVAFPGVDAVTINGINFGTDASKVAVSFNGTAATIQTIADNKITVTAPANYATGFVSITMGGLTVQGTPAIINPTAAGDITPYFLSNTGNFVSGGGFVSNTDAYASNRWGTLGAPWITNAGAKNKTNASSVKVGGWSKDGGSRLCWETWGDTPVVDGKVYQQTSMALPAGSYTVSFTYYSENHPTSSVYCVAATGDGLPSLANLNTALGYVGTWNSTPVGATVPNSATGTTNPITAKFDFTLATSQKVSIGFLANMAGAATKADYFIVGGMKLVKN